MRRICWWLVERMSGMLEPDEWEAVQGDFAESGETGEHALRDVLGLVARRQAALWRDWRPWLALVGLAAPLGALLSLVSRRSADGSAIYIWLYWNNWTWAYLTNVGARRDLIHYAAGIVIGYLTLACASWIGGLALRRLSRGAIRVNGALFCLVLFVTGAPSRYHNPGNAAVFSLTFYSVMFPLIVQTVLVLLPSFWGMRQARGEGT